jgi:hypothetical protein
MESVEISHSHTISTFQLSVRTSDMNYFQQHLTEEQENQLQHITYFCEGT